MSPMHTLAANATDVTEAELSVLKVLWHQGPASIRTLADSLYPGGSTAHYATVQKLLERLQRKSFVSRQQEGRANIYRPTVAKEELIARRLQATANTLCEGSLTPLLTQLVDRARLSPADLSTLRALVERLDPETSGAGGDES